ncbi:serine/threonine-protein kinase ZRK1 [Ziziphus jujuba]|uniref:Serine/threonine-protein kinase ZRK1 n=1 Tax=Ziziphus jujuba TaxID=326968 RepID=A0ABM4AEH0_ZIZJJ|nr:serine/threonine-protein kinase ZRK1 [Ziziphus jujuba]
MGKKEEQHMVKNGGMVLEELISTGNGRCNPIRNFSAKQLLEATNNFHSPSFTTRGEEKWFKAFVNNRPVLIKKVCCSEPSLTEVCRDIAISSQMSSHGRVLKLLGCCLEFPVPALVYEDAENGPLNRYGGTNGQSLPWMTRLRIAKDIANALTNLHTAFSRPIIHLSVEPSNVLLDTDFVPKLCNFSRSVSIPEGETQVKVLQFSGTFGFLDPHYINTFSATEKTDVYSFGVFLLVLLTGKPACDMQGRLVDFVAKKPWNEIVDSTILEEEGVTTEKQQKKLLDFLNLGLKCTQDGCEDRPTMIDVAKELVRIHSSTPAP